MNNQALVKAASGCCRSWRADVVIVEVEHGGNLGAEILEILEVPPPTQNIRHPLQHKGHTKKRSEEETWNH
jgi:hypothetical protein